MRCERNICSDVPPAGGVPAEAPARAKPSLWARATRACPVLCALAGLLTGGCGVKPVQLKDEADFNQRVLKASQPAVVDFYKGGCPTCLMLDGTMDKLTEEYKGRAIVARFEIMKPYFAVTAPELKEKYDISLFPTVILFLNGEPAHHWVLEYNADKYREVLDEALAAETAEAPEVVEATEAAEVAEAAEVVEASEAAPPAAP